MAIERGLRVRVRQMIFFGLVFFELVFITEVQAEVRCFARSTNLEWNFGSGAVFLKERIDWPQQL